MTDLRYAVVQSGYAVFGVGHTEAEAIADAATWIEPKEGRQGDLTPEQVADMCVTQPMDGDLCIISADNDPKDFDSHMRANGGYVLRNGKWCEQ